MKESIRHLIVRYRIVILVRTAGERSRHVQPDLIHECREVSGPTNGDCRSAEEILEDQIPTDDPGDELAEGRIAVSVCTAGDRDHAREFGAAEASEKASQSG